MPEGKLLRVIPIRFLLVENTAAQYDIRVISP